MRDRPDGQARKRRNGGHGRADHTFAAGHPADAVEIPAVTQARLGLDGARSCIVVSEVNRFEWPGSDLRPVSRAQTDRFDFGLLPPSIFRQVRDRLAECAKAQRLKSMPRTE